MKPCGDIFGHLEIIQFAKRKGAQCPPPPLVILLLTVSNHVYHCNLYNTSHILHIYFHLEVAPPPATAAIAGGAAGAIVIVVTIIIVVVVILRRFAITRLRILEFHSMFNAIIKVQQPAIHVVLFNKMIVW